MKKLVCEEFRTDSFSNGDELEWDRNISYVDYLHEVYKFENGVKDLFYSLLQTGKCISVDSSRIEIVREILKSEGYNINE